MERPSSTRCTFLDTPMDALSFDDTLTLIEQAIVTKKRLHQVSLNVAKLVHMRRDKDLRADVTTADLISIDGMGVVWGARLAGHRVPERVAGIDVFYALLQRCAAKGYRPYFFGARQAVLDRALDNAVAAFPALTIAGSANGYFSADDESGIVDDINASGADCLFLGISSPMKERFMARHKKALTVPFVMGVGGSFDILAGRVRRAPRWMQASGLEWLYRLWQEPRRMWKRYATSNMIYAGLLLREIFFRRATRRRP